MKCILILSLFLSLAMFYLGLTQHISYAVFFAVVLLLTAAKFLLDILSGRNDHNE